MPDPIEDLETERVARAAPASAPPAPPPRPRAVAFGVAIAADVLQWVLWPLFMGGAVSPLDDVVDLGVAAVLIRLLGWHWAFLPAFLAEVLPGVDLVPTWTLAVWLATRGKR